MIEEQKNDEKLLINDNKSNNLELKSNNENERNEMADIIAKNSHFQDTTWDASDYEWAAYCLQENGYRKQSEGEWIITAPVVMRVWDSDCVTCSVCGGKSVGLLDEVRLKYCPHCGAKMRGGE